MNNQYSIKRIDSEIYTDEDWKEYFAIRTHHAKESGNPLLFTSWMALKERTLIWLAQGIGIYTLSEGDNSVGFYSFDIRLENEADRRYVYFRDGVLKDLDATLLQSIYVTFMEYDPLSKFLVIKSVNGKHDFLETTANAEIADYRELFELKIANAKIDLIKKWYRDYSEKFSDYDLRHYEDIPDELLEEYCDVFTELLNDMPNESKISDFSAINPKEIKQKQVHNRKHNQCSYRYLVFDNSKLIAKTNVFLNKKNPQKMRQYMTGVLKAYRGQGFGKWLKAAMFLKLMADFPDLEVITTETHLKNVASRGLSKQMGFEKTGFEKDYLISKKFMLEHLNVNENQPL